MENRIARPRADRPGAPLIALMAILAITAAWWALALWPTGATEPEWLARTRAACFGSARGGLPDAGGWILLIGEPIGMLGVLLAVWGRLVKRDLLLIRTNRVWRVAGASIAVLALVGAASLSVRVTRASGFGRSGVAAPRGTPVRLDLDPPVVRLTDQRGRRTSFADFHGQRVLLAFAFGHCSTVCPVIVNDLRAARRSANRPGVPLVVITLDPWRDTPDRLPSIAEHWGLAPGDRVLSGSVAEVEHALDGLGIGRRRNETTGDIEHGGTVMILNERGRIAWRLDGGWTGVDSLLRLAH